MAPARRWFLLESLRELQQRWQQAGSQLLLLEGNPLSCCPAWPSNSEPLVWLGTGMWSPWCASAIGSWPRR